MPDSGTAENLYQQLLAINAQAFQAHLFDAAYHALMAALECAKEMGSDEPLKNISQIAREQNAWIDRNHPEYGHSTQAAAQHNLPESILSRLAEQAEAILTMRKYKRS